jgi:hypothetical protein
MVADRWGRNLLCGSAVLATILLVVFGLPALERAMPSRRAAPAQRQVVADGISVVPPVGSVITQRTRNGTSEGSILFLVGRSRYAVGVRPFHGDVNAAADELKEKILSMRGYQVTADESPVVTATGLAGLGSTFTAPGRSGRYVAFVAHGHIVEVTVNVSGTDFQQAISPIDESIGSIAWNEGR